MSLLVCFFFFSSRRRHTRLQGDWSSDVCSSDLTREKLRQQLKEGTLEEREVEVEVQQQGFPGLEMMQPPQGIEGTDVNFTELLQEMLPKKKKRRTVHLHEARRILIDEELKKLVDMDDVVNESLDRVENHGVIFIDEIDKIAGERGTVGPDLSR